MAHPSKSDDAFAAFWNSAGGLAGFVHTVADPSKPTRTVRDSSKPARRFAENGHSVANPGKPTRTVRDSSKRGHLALAPFAIPANAPGLVFAPITGIATNDDESHPHQPK